MLDSFEFFKLLALVAGGFIAGIINTIAGGGSVITLPLLIIAGLPPTVANATNRIALLAQCLAGLAGFGELKKKISENPDSDARDHISLKNRSGIFSSDTLYRIFIPILAGAVPGSYMATRLSDELFAPVIGILLPVAGVFILFDAKSNAPDNPSTSGSKPWILIILFLSGFYGGFIQAGIGFVFLAVLVRGMGMDLHRANAMKLVLIFIMTLAALAIFFSADLINWRAGIVLAVGMALGGYTGARMAIKMSEVCIKWFIFIILILFSLEMLGIRKLVMNFLISNPSCTFPVFLP